jgi:caffeoyl-CoA O-methyltransferase
VLDEIKALDTEQLAISEEDGRFLRLLVATSGARRVLEIGGASGYSAIWIGLGLRDTGGRLVTIEYDAARAKALAENVRRAGLADIVEVVSGDAFQQIPKLRGPSTSSSWTRGSATTSGSSTWCTRASTGAGCSSATT